jgi:cytochrome c-type biogenesis protein
MELIFAYIAGLLTLINPCILPVLPIVLVAALNADRRGPLALAAGMSLSFVLFGVLVTAFGAAVGLTQELLTRIGAAMMVAFGLILLVPAFSQRFELAAAGLSASADRRIDRFSPSGLRGQFLGGTLLGAVWSPCIGPTLGGAIALASQGQNLIWVTLIMTSFALGVSTLILGLGFSARETIRTRTNRLRRLSESSKPLMGAVFVAIGLMILSGTNHLVDTWILDALPPWIQDLSVAL